MEAIQKIKQKPTEAFKNKKKAEINIQFLLGNEFKSTFEEILQKEELPSESQNPNLQVFKQENFLKGMKLPINYYEICKSLHLEGYPVMMKPHDLHLVYPWLLQIKDINLHIPKITTEIIFENFGLYKYFRKNEKSLYFNTVLPIFTKKDEAFSKIIFSDLF